MRYWLDLLARKDALLVVRFEDLRSDPAEHLRAIAMFIGLDPSDEAVHRAVDDNSLERMREGRAGPSEVLQQHDTAERFVGKGRSEGGARN